jgi:hypothetical protein
VSGTISDAVKDVLGYNPTTRPFDALGSIPHQVQGDQVLVPGREHGHAPTNRCGFVTRSPCLQVARGRASHLL